MTGPAEKPRAGEKTPGGFAQLVRWLNEERPVTGPDDVGIVPGAPRRTARWTYSDVPVAAPKIEAERDALGEVRIGPAPRCAVAGETIALSVSLISARGGIYLGWPIKLAWSSSDPAVASVSDGGVVQVHERGRVEITCTCEGKSGSVVLTVVDPVVAVAVGLPVPAHLLPAPPRRAAGRPAAELAAGLVAELAAELQPAHRRSVERDAGKRGVIASLAPSRATRRLLFRLAVGTATGGFIAVALSQSPEEYFVVGAEPSPAMAAEMSTRSAGQSVRLSAAIKTGLRLGAVSPTTAASKNVPPPGDTSKGTALARTTARAATSAGSTTTKAVAAPAVGAARAAPPSVAAQPAATPEAPAARAQSVSRVVVEPAPSQLTEGESVRLSAASVDDRGETVPGRVVTWKSEDGDVAVVDANGVVTARRPGTATIVATSAGHASRVTLTVGARRPDPPPATGGAVPSSAAPARASGSAAAAQVMRARVEEFVQALRERNGERVAALYQAESPQDRKNLQVLLDRLRRPEARFKASDAQIAAPEIREMEAAADFQVPMSWTTPFGRVRNQTPTFRAVLEPGDGGWRLVAIRAVGKID